MTPAGRCPVCNAKFRGNATCSRCGADLTLLMRVWISAWRRRAAATRLLRDGDHDAARAAARAAVAEHATPAARRLACVLELLRRASVAQ